MFTHKHQKHRDENVIRLSEEDACRIELPHLSSLCVPPEQNGICLGEDMQRALRLGNVQSNLIHIGEAQLERIAITVPQNDPTSIDLTVFQEEEKDLKMEALEENVRTLEDRTKRQETTMRTMQMSVNRLLQWGEEEMKKVANAVQNRVKQVEEGNAAYAFNAKLMVFSDGQTWVKDQPVTDLPPHVGKVLFAFARKKAGYVTYLNLNEAVNGEAARLPSERTKTTLRQYITKARQWLNCHFPRAKIVAQGSGNWMMHEE
ncbi:hypothetical protein COU76_04745 [Candidatus Peregrinibacteria bacterium CG10_big_fil_rev_8_21_14_0_10_49_10]|nr:MAG: hypothetical protein COU76_04745 [Candidatus Peregrinibacteria bacterium CG10_big_fil_rev_8_21_14_0_10_49_10]